MTLRLRIALSCCAAVTLVACEPQGDDPPLFNARDLSLQCPTGQVGWDFSTGGNDSALVENSVSREITIDRAMLGTCDYRADFAADCDGRRECIRQVKKPTSPTCAGGGLLDLSYRCGDETPRYNVVIPADASAQTVNLACGEPLTIFSAVYGSNAPSTANQSVITTAVATACTGKRRCSLDDPYVLNGRNDPWPNNGKDTLVQYFCGNEGIMRSTTIASGARLDIQCPLNQAPAPVFKDTLRVIDVTCADPRMCQDRQATDSYNRPIPGQFDRSPAPAKAAEWLQKLKVCDGKRTCRVELEPDRVNDRYAPRFELRADFLCSSSQAPESKVFYNTNSSNEKFVEIYCGPQIRIVGATVDAPNARNGNNLAEARRQCDNRSRCVVPDLNFDGGTGSWSATYQYTCGENAFDVRNSPQLFQVTNRGRLLPTSPLERQIQCERPNDKLVGGIRVLSAVARDGTNQLLQATNACFGRDLCDFGSDGTVTYRCGSSYEVKTAPTTPGKIHARLLSCIPDVKVVSIACDNSALPNATEAEKKSCLAVPQYFADGTITRPFYSLADAQARCRAGNNGSCDFILRAKDVALLNEQQVTLKWQCGPDPTVYTFEGRGEPEGGGNNGRAGVRVRASCEVTTVPYVEKRCVPEVCPAGTKRDSKLNCIPDGTLTQTQTYSAPIVKEWLQQADGGTALFGGADTTTLVEDFPYQVFGYTQYRTTTGAALPPNTAVTVLAYDEFRAKSTVTDVPTNKRTTFGFRCIVSEAPIRDAEYPNTDGLAGYRKVVNGGKGGVLPLSCFRQNVDDGKNAWSDGARRVGIPESQFRERYERQTSWVVSAVDPTGRFVNMWGTNSFLPAVNPIGFYYNNQNGWVDQLGFYLQRSDLRFKKAVTFVEANEIELNAMNASLRDAAMNLDVAKPELLPIIDVDLTWSQRGDSPARNPYSPRSVLTPNAVVPLDKKRLRATIEVARVRAAPGELPVQEQAGEWVEVNTMVFPAKELGKGNAMSSTSRLSAVITPQLRERLLTVRGTDANELQAPNGLMGSFDEDQTAFRVRVCMDFDGVTHAITGTDTPSSSLNGAAAPTVTRDGTSFGLRFRNRCVQAGALVLKRELFTYPSVPYVTADTPANSASSPRQGDSASGSTNDLGNQSACSDTASATQSCAGQSRNSMTTGGQFSLSAFDTGTTDSAEQGETTKTTRLSSNMTVFGFRIFDLSGGGMSEPQSSGAWRIKIDISPNLQAIMDAWKSRRTGGVKTTADNQKMRTKSKKQKGAVAQFLGEKRDGLALKLGKEFPFTLGPFPFVLEVSFSVGFGFGASITIGGDRQTVANMVNPKYPCLKSTAGQCVVAYPDMGTTVKTYEEALQDCRFKGGTLAEVRTPTDLQEVRTAVQGVGTANSAFWLGGQAAYQFASSRCNQTPVPAQCAGTSRTRWSWLTGNAEIGTQLRQGPVVFNNANLGFPANNAGVLTTFVPDPGAVLFKKDTAKLISARTTDTAAWVCQFDPASSYIETTMGVEVKAEFTMGFQAKLCTPSADIGFCLGVGVNLVAAGINVSAERSRMLIFNNNRIKVGLLGESKVAGAWEVSFMSGSFSAELNFLFSSLSWEIASYEGLYKIEGELFPEIVTPYARTFP